MLEVRTRASLGNRAEVLAANINLVANMAGATYPERNPQYLANLARLGLVRPSDEQVKDPRRYSFLEAQPDATAAMGRARRTHTEYRSVAVTPFGRQFAEACFTLDGYDAGGWVNDIR
jgi:hypothetical protein